MPKEYRSIRKLIYITRHRYRQIFIFSRIVIAAGCLCAFAAAAQTQPQSIDTNVGTDADGGIDTVVNTDIIDAGIIDTGTDVVNTDAGVSPAKYKFALILSGGGSRGLAQIGTLMALEEAGLKPDLIVSTSMGSVIGGLYACGYSPLQILEIARSMDWSRVSTNTNLRPSLFVSQKAPPKGYLFDVRLGDNFRPALPNAISNGQIFYELLTARTLPALHSAGYDFSNLPVSLRVVATDLLTGRKVVFSEGSLPAAIRASCSAPLAFSPLDLDGKMLVDGGITSNIPVQVAADAGAEFTVAIDVTSPLWGRKQLLDNPVRLMEQIVSIGVAQNKLRDTHEADVLITPQLGAITNTDFSRIDTLVAIGYAATVKAVPEIAARLGKPIVNLPAKAPDQSSQNADKAHTRRAATQRQNGDTILPSVKSVRIFGNEKTLERQILTASGIKIGIPLDSATVERAIRSLYSTELFESVRLETSKEENVDIHVTEEKYWRLRGGLRYDEYRLGEGFIEPAYDNIFGMGISAALHLQYGLRKEKYAVNLTTDILLTQNWAINCNAQIFTAREQIYSRNEYQRFTLDSVRVRLLPDSIIIRDNVLGKSGVALILGSQIGKSVSLEAGAKLEWFDLLQSNQNFDKDFGFGFRKSLPYFLLRLTTDTRDVTPFTRNGWRHTVTAGMAGGRALGLGGIEEFRKVDGNFNRYVTFLNRHTLHLQAVAGWTDHTLPEVEKFFLGGAIPEQNYRDADIYNTIPFMGMKPRKVSADVFGLAHMEYRLKIRKNLYMSAMLDWARLWEYVDFINDDNNLPPKSPMGLGVGASYKTPLGPIRFSYGRLIRHQYDPEAIPEDVFYFSAGHDF